MTTDTSSKDQGEEQNKGVEGSSAGYLVYAWLNSGTGDLLGHRNTLDHGHIKCV